TTEMTELGKERCSINLGQPTPSRVAFTKDGHELAVVTGSVIRRFVVPKEAYTSQLTEHTSRIESIAAHPESPLVAVLNNRASVLFFDSRYGMPAGNRRLTRVKVNSAAWMPGGKVLAVVGAGLEFPTPKETKFVEPEIRMVDPETTGYRVHRGSGKPY